jgi:two-component system cell cycle sensor histidine kinase/response regulator CckA
LADDEVGIRRLARSVLSDQGCVVLDAENGEEALRLCRQHPGKIDLLVTDVVMPVMGGRELAENASAIRPGIRVLFMSGYTGSAFARHGMPSDGEPFLSKPFTPRMLAEKVRAVLAGRIPS